MARPPASNPALMGTDVRALKEKDGSPLGQKVYDAADVRLERGETGRASVAAISSSNFAPYAVFGAWTGVNLASP